MSAGTLTKDFFNAGLRTIEGDASLAEAIEVNAGGLQYVSAGGFAVAPITR